MACEIVNMLSSVVEKRNSFLVGNEYYGKRTVEIELMYAISHSDLEINAVGRCLQPLLFKIFI